MIKSERIFVSKEMFVTNMEKINLCQLKLRNCMRTKKLKTMKKNSIKLYI